MFGVVLGLACLPACTITYDATAPHTPAQDVPWVDAELYPFASHFVPVDDGSMHYVDEGQGSTVLLLHGTPTWSFLYRDVIAELASDHRVIAPDLLGYGLSDKPSTDAYHPAAQARRLAQLIEHLDLRDLTIVAHDVGGPLGMSVAIDHPDRVAQVVLVNTFAWSLADDPGGQKIDRFVTSRTGRRLYLKRNFSARKLLPSAFRHTDPLADVIQQHYERPFSDPDARYGAWQTSTHLVGAHAWYAALWDRRAELADRPVHIVWGLQDRFFGEEHLDTWRSGLPHATVTTLPEVGHFVPEEAPLRLAAEIRTQQTPR